MSSGDKLGDVMQTGHVNLKMINHALLKYRIRGLDIVNAEMGEKLWKKGVMAMFIQTATMPAKLVSKL